MYVHVHVYVGVVFPEKACIHKSVIMHAFFFSPESVLGLESIRISLPFLFGYPLAIAGQLRAAVFERIKDAFSVVKVDYLADYLGCSVEEAIKGM